MSKGKKDLETNENNSELKNKNNKKKRMSKKKRKVIIRVSLLVILAAIIIAGGAVLGMVLGIVKSAPKIDATNVLNTLTESSVIVDENDVISSSKFTINENREK